MKDINKAREEMLGEWFAELSGDLETQRTILRGISNKSRKRAFLDELEEMEDMILDMMDCVVTLGRFNDRMVSDKPWDSQVDWDNQYR
jgi:hypothetical protein